MTDPKKIASLEKIYQAMDSAEIEHRLAHGELSPIAREVAKSELERRSAAYASGVDSEAAKIPNTSDSGVLFQLSLAALIIFLGYAFLRIVMGWSNGVFVAIFVVFVLPCIAAMFGKSFPRFGGLIGAAIIVYGAYFYFSTEIKGDHLERGLTHVFLAVYTMGYVILGSFFLMGAFFKGTDDELDDKLNEYVDDMTEAVRRLH
ncbi:hypothetical protein LJR066_003036 [Acidovorax sp. LjRoot66]|uniref:hypothetical protein n=1 Tax=Acidovorax sp. LjRoot66 TaxID=3342334 RepID=UPI003ECDFDED